MENGIDYNKPATTWLIFTYIFVITGGLLAIVFGIHVYKSMVPDENGEKVYKYKDAHRKLGLVGAILGAVSGIIWRVALM